MTLGLRWKIPSFFGTIVRMSTDLHALIAKHKHLSEEAQMKAGQSKATPMPEEHKKFVATVVSLVERGEIDLHNTDSFMNQTAYGKLSDEQKGEIALAVVNLATEIEHIYEFFKSKQTPNESSELQHMVEYAWQKVQKIEASCGDVFKF